MSNGYMSIIINITFIRQYTKLPRQTETYIFNAGIIVHNGRATVLTTYKRLCVCLCQTACCMGRIRSGGFTITSLIIKYASERM